MKIKYYYNVCLTKLLGLKLSVRYVQHELMTEIKAQGVFHLHL